MHKPSIYQSNFNKLTKLGIYFKPKVESFYFGEINIEKKKNDFKIVSLKRFKLKNGKIIRPYDYEKNLKTRDSFVKFKNDGG